VSLPSAQSPAKPKTSPALEEALASLRERGPGDAASPGTRARALASIRRVLRGGAAVSAEEARVVVAAASRALQRGGESHAGGPEPSAETKTHALFTLRDLARCSPESFAPHASTALPVILDALEDPEGVERDPEIALGAGDALDGVVDAIAPEAALRALAPRLKLTRSNPTGVGLSQTQTRGSSFSAAPVRCVGGVVARMSGEALRSVAPEILPGLCEAFNSTSADVRKAVVDALVAMYDQLGDWLLPRLAGLTAAQQKLLTIYINRAAERREKNAERDADISARLGLKNGAPSGRVPLAPRPAQ
jgi:CLIP-associating protein 1/2